MNRLNITLLLAELLCLTLIVIGNRLIFWEEQQLIGWLIIGIAACMSVLIVLVLVFHETEEKEEGPVFRWDFGPRPTKGLTFDLTPVYLKHEGERLPSHCSHFICNKCGQRVEKGAFNITQHTDNCPAKK